MSRKLFLITVVPQEALTWDFHDLLNLYNTATSVHNYEVYIGGRVQLQLTLGGLVQNINIVKYKDILEIYEFFCSDCSGFSCLESKMKQEKKNLNIITLLHKSSGWCMLLPE